jgi:hypothetical protein
MFSCVPLSASAAILPRPLLAHCAHLTHNASNQFFAADECQSAQIDFEVKPQINTDKHR